MKRGGFIARRSPLPAGKRLNRVSKKRAKMLRDTQPERDAVRLRDGGRCMVQSPDCAPWTGMGFGHIESAAQGGQYHRTNGVYCCNACNQYVASHQQWAAARGFSKSKKYGLPAHPVAPVDPLTTQTGKPMSRNGVGRSDCHGTATSD